MATQSPFELTLAPLAGATRATCQVLRKYYARSVLAYSGDSVDYDHLVETARRFGVRTKLRKLGI